MFLLTWVFLSSCTKEIEVELPPSTRELVVEGRIETGTAPLVWLGWTQGYFEPFDLAFSGDFFLGGADVRLRKSGGEQTELTAICTGDLPQDVLNDISVSTQLPLEMLLEADLCFYTSLDAAWLGTSETSYQLTVELEDVLATATTYIPKAVVMDSIWFESPGPPDSLGIAHALVTDPDTLGNAYRWFARRLNTRPSWDVDAGQPKDADFIAPLGSVIDDEFFNGLTFEFSAFRGIASGSQHPEDQLDHPEYGYFKAGDTVVVKNCTIDPDVYRALASYESAILGQGSPFTIPADMLTNVEGGRGLFAGYGVSLDTVIYEP